MMNQWDQFTRVQKSRKRSHLEQPYESESSVVAAEGFRVLNTSLQGHRPSSKLKAPNTTHKYPPSSGHVVRCLNIWGHFVQTTIVLFIILKIMFEKSKVIYIFNPAFFHISLVYVMKDVLFTCLEKIVSLEKNDHKFLYATKHMVPILIKWCALYI